MLSIILWFFYWFKWVKSATIIKISGIYSIVIFYDWLFWWNSTYYAFYRGEIYYTTMKYFKLIMSIICG